MIDPEPVPGGNQNRVAVVTGAAGGIGGAVCLRLCRDGYDIVAVDCNERALSEFAAALKAETATGSVTAIALDVALEPDMQRLTDALRGGPGRVDVLIAAAGILRPKGCPPRPVAELSLAEWDAVISINLTGIFLSDRAVLPLMLSQHSGQIINVSSTSGKVGRALDSAYCASKFAVLGLTESLAAEVATSGVRVNAILPDAVDTPLWAQNGPIPKPSNALSPQRVADLVAFLVAMPADTVLMQPVIAPAPVARPAPRLRPRPSRAGPQT
jgi:NAD(P)-dependent dehydrogenase (short-subunit alcohol dehydrogenase family)